MAKGEDGKLEVKLKLREGMTGLLIKKKGKWLGVNMGGTKGWVKASAVEIENSEASGDEEDADESDTEASKARPAIDLGGGYSPYLGSNAGFTFFFPISKKPSGNSLDLGIEANLYFANPAKPITASLLFGFPGRKKSVQFFIGGQAMYLAVLDGQGSAFGGGIDTRLVFNTGKLNPYINVKFGTGGGEVIAQYLGGIRFNL